MITVESIYQARRDEQARRLELRIEGIYQDHPQLKEINDQINHFLINFLINLRKISQSK